MSCTLWHVGESNHTDVYIFILHHALAIIESELCIFSDSDYANDSISNLCPSLEFIGGELCIGDCGHADDHMSIFNLTMAIVVGELSSMGCW